jgi:hypothetical protein
MGYGVHGTETHGTVTLSRPAGAASEIFRNFPYRQIRGGMAYPFFRFSSKIKLSKPTFIFLHFPIF